MRYLWSCIGILAVIYFIVINILGGRIYFSEVFLILGLIAIVISVFYNKILNVDFIKKHIKFIRGLIVACISIFVIFETMIIMYPKKSLEKSNVIIVLGAGLRGSIPSLTLRYRLDSTIEYINKTDYNGKIIVSGGQGQGEDITEAEAMKNYLIDKGISSDRIIKEDKSTSTSENLRFSKEVIKNNLNYDVGKNIKTTIITTDFHAMRSNMLAKRNGYENVKLYTTSTEWYLIPNMYFREFFAFIKSLILDR